MSSQTHSHISAMGTSLNATRVFWTIYPGTAFPFPRSISRRIVVHRPNPQVWYNVGHLSLGIGDVNLAYQVSQQFPPQLENISIWS